MVLLDLPRAPVPPLLPELDEAGLERAADAFFPNGTGISDAELARLSAAFYAGADLPGRAEIWQNGDVSSLHRTIPLALRRAVQARARPSRPGRLLVIGCGDGRLLGTIGATALMYGATELILNDLHPFHLDAAREVIAANGLVQRGLRVRMLPGDITAVAGEVACDVALALFFVDAEIVSVESVAALRARRSAYHAAVARCLGPGGVFIMDRPDASTGFYGDVRRIARRILIRRRLMPGESGNLDLAWIPGGAQPYHLRYVPTHEAHRKAMRDAGFTALDARIQVAQENQPAGFARRKVVEVRQVRKSGEPVGETLPLPGLFDAPTGLVVA